MLVASSQAALVRAVATGPLKDANYQGTVSSILSAAEQRGVKALVVNFAAKACAS